MCESHAPFVLSSQAALVLNGPWPSTPLNRRSATERARASETHLVEEVRQGRGDQDLGRRGFESDAEQSRSHETRETTGGGGGASWINFSWDLLLHRVV